MGKGKEYTTVHIPKALVVAIDKVLEAGAYASRSEFVKEAIRRHLETYGLTKVLYQELLLKQEGK
jgi:Arc/MetJ-type ribon-helix-helix transcriptional regulator